MNKKELEKLNEKEQAEKLTKDIAKDLHPAKKEHHTLVEEEQIIEEKVNNEVFSLRDKINNSKAWYIGACIVAALVGITFACLLGFGII